jgi:uncharacterized protein YndB with AHSA1/START domain
VKTVPVIKEAVILAPVNQVWTALTDKEALRIWFFRVDELRPEPDFEFRFNREKDNKRYAVTGKILLAVPEKKLSYAWSYEDFPARTIVTFDMAVMEDGTKVRITHEGLEKIPQKYKQVSVQAHSESWDSLIKALKNHLERVTA